MEYEVDVFYTSMDLLDALEKNPERGLGPKFVLLVADEASYTSMLNMNHMLIRVPLHWSSTAEAEGKKRLQSFDERYYGF